MIEIRELFDYAYGVNLEFNQMTETPDGIPFVSRQSQNNGVVGYVEKLKGIVPNPAMTISLSASGSVMESFLQEKEYYSGRDLYYLKPKIELTKEQMLYYCMILRANKYRYSFGRQANKTLGSIKIPSPDDIPAYIDKVKVKKPTASAALSNKLCLSDREWKFFTYEDLFKIQGTKTTPLRELEDYGKGGYPYVTTQAVDNGVEGFFNHETESGNVLCVDSAVLGYCSYQERNFTASDHVEKLELIEPTLTKYIAMFLVTISNLEQYRYSYGRKRSQGRLENELIKLPIDLNEKPDWQFMEDYIKSLPYSSSL